MEKMAPPICPACNKNYSWKKVGEGRSGYALGKGILLALLLNLVFGLLMGIAGAILGLFAGLLCGLSGKKSHIYYCINCGYKGEYRDGFPEHLRKRIPYDGPKAPELAQPKQPALEPVQLAACPMKSEEPLVVEQPAPKPRWEPSQAKSLELISGQSFGNSKTRLWMLWLTQQASRLKKGWGCVSISLLCIFAVAGVFLFTGVVLSLGASLLC